MSDAAVWLGLAAWYAIGVSSHIFWVRNQYDYTSSYIPTSLFCGIVGPMAFWIGWTVYRTRSTKPPRLLLRKRS